MEIKKIISEIKKLDNYCLINEATENTFNKTVKYFGEMPKDLQEFYKNFNGGAFFGHDFACINKQKYCYTFKELNDSEFKEMNYIPENVIVFCDTGYGDFVGYNSKSKNIIQINPEIDENEWVQYNTFTDFLDNFLKESKALIKDGVLEPLY